MRIAITGPSRTGKSTLARQAALNAGKAHVAALAALLPIGATSPDATWSPAPILCTDPKHLVKDLEPDVEYVPTSAVAGHAGVTDDVWSLSSDYVAAQFLTRPGPWVLEGVGVPRALRKWLRAQFVRLEGLNVERVNTDDVDRHARRWALESLCAPPFERLIILSQPKAPQKPGQVAQGKGLMTVLEPMLPWLRETCDVEAR